jgi:histidinol-phosphate aminotransferase
MSEELTLHRRRHGSVVNLSSNELIHPALSDILRRAARHFDPAALNRYPDFHMAAARIAEAIGITPDRLLLTPGTDMAIRAIIRQYVDTASSSPRLILQDPNYYAWEQVAAVIPIPLTRVRWTSPEDQGPSLIAAARAERGALVALSFPNAPIGGRMRLQDLDVLMGVCATQGHRLVVDTCYAAFDRELPRLEGHLTGDVLQVRSLSKSHGLAGCRLGVITGAPDSVAALAGMRIEHAVSTPAIILAQGMLAEGAELISIWDDIARIRGGFIAKLYAMGLKPLPSGGNFVTFRAGSAATASRIAAQMAVAGYRIKLFSDKLDYADCLRMTVAHSHVLDPACIALAASIRLGET